VVIYGFGFNSNVTKIKSLTTDHMSTSVMNEAVYSSEGISVTSTEFRPTQDQDIDPQVDVRAVGCSPNMITDYYSMFLVCPKRT